MPRSLPFKPSLEYVRKEARNLLAAHQSGDASVCGVLRLHHRFKGASDGDMLAAAVSLQEMQHALALDYGFKSWVELKQHALAAAVAQADANTRVTQTSTAEQRTETCVGREGGNQVLIESAIAALDDLCVGDDHGATVGGEKYEQPPVYLEMHLVEMKAAGWQDVDFDTVAAVSGASGLFAYQPDHLGPKYWHLHVEPDRRIAEATGFGYTRQTYDDAAGAWQIIKGCLDTGKCVKGWHYENCLFVGYREADGLESRGVYVLGQGPGRFNAWWTWTEFCEWVGMVSSWGQRNVGYHTERLPEVGARDMALRVLRELVAWSTEPPEACRRTQPNAKYGLAGIEAYADDVAGFPAKRVSYFKESAWQACHAINPQWSIRNCSATYIRRVAQSGMLPALASQHLFNAATEYRAVFEAWQEFYDQLGHHAPEGAWDTAARREAGGAAARRWLEHERTAIEHISAALSAVD